MQFTTLLGLLAAAVAAAPTGNTTALRLAGPTAVGATACKSSTLSWIISVDADPTGKFANWFVKFDLRIATDPMYRGWTKEIYYKGSPRLPVQTTKSTDGKFKVQHFHPDGYEGKEVALIYKNKRYYHGTYQSRFGDTKNYVLEYWDCLQM
ncbi:hypothetical protein BG015_011650 [Linnemannia schmuckeri]|uniref:Uncharacterized protein n=1 Tax=Linnemannia schmuckeri TaxID=64567 RepID=A0A9P5RSD4_9FUNG|nr:hypothetical protein BG015_011650 [Linnemannia schmuckeri]